jgi:hypothetical protein
VRKRKASVRHAGRRSGVLPLDPEQAPRNRNVVERMHSRAGERDARSRGTDCGARVARALLAGRRNVPRIRRSGPTLVEDDESSERRQSLDEARQRRFFPRPFEAGDEPGRENGIARSRTEDPVGDARVAGAGVSPGRGMMQSCAGRAGRSSGDIGRGWLAPGIAAAVGSRVRRRATTPGVRARADRDEAAAA